MLIYDVARIVDSLSHKPFDLGDFKVFVYISMQFPPFFSKGDNLCEFPVTSLHHDILPKT